MRTSISLAMMFVMGERKELEESLFVSGGLDGESLGRGSPDLCPL